MTMTARCGGFVLASLYWIRIVRLSAGFALLMLGLPYCFFYVRLGNITKGSSHGFIADATKGLLPKLTARDLISGEESVHVLDQFALLQAEQTRKEVQEHVLSRRELPTLTFAVHYVVRRFLLDLIRGFAKQKLRLGDLEHHSERPGGWTAG